ncbi:hypothetical protein J5S76_07345 [Bacillus amyloliquefaciens]|nr:hypothetical protein [Bacillus amyloliquefaciens]
MKNTPLFWEDEKNLYISQEAIKQLPDEIREQLESHLSYGKEMLAKADEDIMNLKRLVKMMTTVSSLNFIHQRLRNTSFEITIDSALEHEMLTTAFVVTYSRLFVGTTGASRISEKKIPKHLKNVHSELMEIRHQRYAHNGEHESISSSIEIEFSGGVFDILLNYELGMYVGGRDEWVDLVQFVNQYVYDQICKNLDRLREKTGHIWNFSQGPSHGISEVEE